MASSSYLCSHLVFILASLCLEGIGAFDWAPSSPADGTVLQACVGEKVSFPWKFSLSEDETVMNVEWYKQTDGDLEIIATDVAGYFLKLPGANFSVEFLPNAEIAISNFTFTDFGTYGVNIIYKSNGTLFSESSYVVLQLPDAPVLKKNSLEARIEPELVTDVITGERHLKLSCGTFLQLGNRPIAVEWGTPGNKGASVPSSSYSDGNFHLTLPNPVVGGTYVCRLTDPSVVARCVRHMSASLRHGDYVIVDEVKARLKLLEGGMTELDENDGRTATELTRQREVDQNLAATDRELKSKLDLQHELYETLNETLHTDLASLRQEHTSDVTELQNEFSSKLDTVQDELDGQRDTDAELRSGLASLKEQQSSIESNLRENISSDLENVQEQLTNQAQTDEDIRAELQTERSKVRQLESKVIDMKAVEDRLQQAQAKWMEDLGKIDDKFKVLRFCRDHYFRDSCYSVVKESSEWRQAKVKCESQGGKLLEIESSEENDFVKTLASSWGYATYWIGGTDQSWEGTWKWHSTGAGLSFSYWNKNEPNNAGSDEDCMEMVKSVDWKWNDNKCYKSFQAICEYRAPY